MVSKLLPKLQTLKLKLLTRSPLRPPARVHDPKYSATDHSDAVRRQQTGQRELYDPLADPGDLQAYQGRGGQARVLLHQLLGDQRVWNLLFAAVLFADESFGWTETSSSF